MQNKVPKVLRETLEPATWPANPELEWCPPGHGEVYIALATTGILDLLLARGYKYLFISNADNLGATLDLGILGYVAAQKLPFLMEVADRTEADKKGGHLAQRPNGQLILREVAQCPKEDLPAFQDIERHRYFNTNNIWINLVRLKATLEDRGNVLPLPMIRNAKTLDSKDEESPPVYQLETAMGAAIAVFPGAQALRVPRERFLPVKLCSDLLALRSDAYILEANYSLRPNPARRNKPLTVDLDPEYYQYVTDFEARFPGGPPSLVACSRLAVRGDVVFEAGVVCKGAVQVANPQPEQRRVPSGTVIANTTFEAR
jgi:UTP--glucose-1-phosphate uridylyltransferase